MERVIATLIFLLGLAHFQAPEKEKSHVVLPSPQLLRCKSADCYQLWSEKPEADAIFPNQLLMDMNQDCLYGMEAIYDKSVSLHDIESAINEHYSGSKMADFEKTHLRLWRVESEKFSIQLSESNKKTEKMGLGEVGTKHAIYIAFGGKSACAIP